MSLADADSRPKRRNLTPWAAGAAALLAIAVLLWVVLGGGGGKDSGGERRGLGGARRVATVNAVDAVPLNDLDPSPLAVLGGPGSAVTGEGAFTPGGPPAVQTGGVARPRRAPRRRADPAPSSSSPGYRVLGPQASDAPAAPPPSSPPPPPPEG